MPILRIRQSVLLFSATGVQGLAKRHLSIKLFEYILMFEQSSLVIEKIAKYLDDNGLHILGRSDDGGVIVL
jgi:hypothetical protein